ncbi:MAG TPA: gamma carbonic anhydrase family protein [Baekduia sp.]|nr:gamma carbonic anhydrase family protein [Baekduia sp.]
MIQRLGDAVPEIAADAWVHAQATVIGDVTIGPGASIWPGAVLRGDYGPIRVGARTSIQDNAVIHADAEGTVIGDDCIVGHLAFVENAVVGDSCLVGVGAKLLPGTRMRAGSVAAAGAVLLGIEVPSGYRAQGLPAVIVRTDRPGRAYVDEGARRYAEMARRHRREARTV